MLNRQAGIWLASLVLYVPFAPAQVFAQAAPAAINGIAYRVVIEGAGGFSGLLAEHLDIVRRQADSGLTVAEVQRRVAVAVSQIREILATEGYFSTSVQPSLERDGLPWTARFQVHLGPPAMVESVDLRFSGALAQGPHADPERAAMLRRSWLLPPGDVFQQEAWTEAKNALLRDLLVRDFPAATIAHSEARIDPATQSAALLVEVNSGPVFTLGNLDIRGLERYSPIIIERLNPIRPGERYNQERLNELQERVQETGYFQSAFATIEVDPARPDLVPVRVDVNEHPRRRLAIGGGLSTDTGVRLQLRWLDRNVLGRDWRLESELLLDRETRLGAADLYLRPLDNGWQPSVSAHLERTLPAGETNDKIRTGLRLTSPNRRDERVWTLALLADRQRIGTAFETNRQALIGSFIYTKRRMDNPLNPRRGYLASIELGAGPRGLVNQDNIGRILVRANAVYPIAPQLRLLARGQIGQVIGGRREDIPADLLFRTGGDQSVRGYGYQTLGVPLAGAVVGGKVMSVLSAELVYQITPQWGAALFIDAGDAAERWSAIRLARGTGVGVRWSSPIGQINVDVAYGHRTREPRLHFSVGYGF